MVRSLLAIGYRVGLREHSLVAMTAEDVLYLRPKFWELHTDNVHSLDAAAFTLLTIQYNLMGGTLAAFAEKRPELQPIMDKVMRFDVS